MMTLPIVISTVSVIVAIAAFIAKVKEEQKKSGPSKKKNVKPVNIGKTVKPVSFGKNAMLVSATEEIKSKTNKAKYDGMAAFRSLENRNNDWLARQLREEKQKERLYSEMYGLKRRHEENCPADRLRREHEKSCDADGVDTGRV